MQLKIIGKFGEFIKSKSYDSMSKGETNLAKRLRSYKAKYDKGSLSPISALSLLIDCGKVKEIKFQDI